MIVCFSHHCSSLSHNSFLFFKSFFPYRYGPATAEAPVQQAKKIRVLPTTANGSSNNSGVSAVKLRPTDNGLALQKVGTLHIANRKLTELHHTLAAVESKNHLSPSKTPNAAGLEETIQLDGSDETRSPTPDYDKRSGRSRNKKKVKAPTAPSTPAASAKSGSSRVDEQPASKSSGRGKLRLFKTKSTDSKPAESEGRIRAKSMEYLRADLADETQEVRRRHSSREDLSGDESLLAFTKNGPVTVFSSEKKLNETDDDDWEEMPSLSRPALQPEQPKQQFYFGMTPGDVAVATGGPPPPAQSLDLDEESRRVMEEFDAVLADSKSIERKSENDEREARRSRRPAKKSNSSSSGSDLRRHSSPAPPPPPVLLRHSDSRRTVVDHDDEDDQDIALSLRPTLPKKPQQLPRFSPSAAWRALSQSSDQYPRSSNSSKLNASSSKASDMSAMDLSDEEDEDEDVMEERIAKNALRPVAPHPPRISNEKSADSGISGDAGSPDAAMASGGRDKPLAMSSPVPPTGQPQRQQLQHNWTPQQDLLDDSSGSSSEVDMTDGPCPARHDPSPPKIMPKSQMFNDSMTDSNNAGSRGSSMSKNGHRKYRKRNETGGSSRTDEGGQIPQKYNSLRKLKRSVSGAFATAFRRSKSPSDDECANPVGTTDDGNWMLSRSAPNSVINGSVGDSPSIRKLHRSEADLLAQNGGLHLGQQYPAYSQPSVLTQRIVYLPQYDSRVVQRGRPMDQTEMMRRARSADAVFLESKGLGQRMFGSKKFTFQSTVRVQEKRMLEEKLSREAEHKERKRLQEMQAMQRVEEEFQRKRAREKANIRQQLRVLQLDHYKHQEQLMMLQQQQHHQQQRIARLDPEGAPSSISHHRTSSDELQQQKQSPVKGLSQQQRHSSSAAIAAAAAVIRSPAEQKRRESAPVSQAPLLRISRNGPIRPDEESPSRKGASGSKQVDQRQPSPPQQQQPPQIDYRREVINSSRTRSAAASATSPTQPAGHLADVRTTGGERNNNNNNNVVQNKKSSNIYRRLAEITSEEESIASPPPVPLLVVTSSSSPSRSSAGMSPIRQPTSSAHRSPAVHVVTNGANNKVMTQELSEYRQERREYRDFRSPRHHHQQQQLIASPPGKYNLVSKVQSVCFFSILHL